MTVNGHRRGGDITVASYNIRAARGRDRRRDPGRIVAVIGETGADIVGLQEVAAHHGPGNGIDQFHFFERATGFHGVAGANITVGSGRFGNALLSRWPIRSARLIDLSVPPYEPRGAIDARIDAGGTALRVIVTHLGLRRRERRRQLTRLSELIGDDDGPTVIMGDFNAWAFERPLLAGVGAPADPSLIPRSYPTGLPVLALDRVWTEPGHHLRDVAVHRSRRAAVASDHYPVTARIAVADGA